MLKTISSIVLLLISVCTFAQKKTSNDKQVFFKLQGGYVYDSHNLRDYAGFNILNFGLTRWNGKYLDGIDLELISYKLDPDFGSIGSLGSNWSRDRNSIELSAYRTFNVIGNINNGLFLGPRVSYAFTHNKFISASGNNFPRDEKYNSLGFGVHVSYYAKLMKKLYLVVGTKMDFIALELQKDKIEDPALTVRQQEFVSFDLSFIENYIPFYLGVGYSF